MRTPRVYAMAALVGALLLAGCGGGTDRVAEPCGPLENAGSGPRSGAVSAGELRFLTALQVEADGCVDRLSFEFRTEPGGRPGFRVQYLPASLALVEDGSGFPIELEGSAFLVVRFEPAATAELQGEELVFTYTGPRRLRPDSTKFVRELVKSGDFEAVLTWVIGLPEERPFRVIESSSPTQLVVEVG